MTAKKMQVKRLRMMSVETLTRVKSSHAFEIGGVTILDALKRTISIGEYQIAVTLQNFLSLQKHLEQKENHIPVGHIRQVVYFWRQLGSVVWPFGYVVVFMLHGSAKRRITSNDTRSIGYFVEKNNGRRIIFINRNTFLFFYFILEFNLYMLI